jgi:dTDP-4-amino-4,6-dideoxygalactose transaminase
MGDLPDAEACQKDVLSLPICPEMNEEKVAYVTSVMDEFKKTHLTQLK